MKYMIMTFGDTAGLEGKSPEWINEMVGFMHRIDVELTGSGELVFQQGLADPSQARTVKVQQGVPVATDGPFAQSRESLVGFWVVDVEHEARAVEVAARISQAADAPIEVRRCMDAPPDGAVLRGLRGPRGRGPGRPRRSPAAQAERVAVEILRGVGGVDDTGQPSQGRVAAEPAARACHRPSAREAFWRWSWVPR
jgi:hypothetical protein